MSPWQCIIFEADRQWPGLPAWTLGTLVAAPTSGAHAAVSYYAAQHLADRPGVHLLTLVTGEGGSLAALRRKPILRRFRVTVPSQPAFTVEEA